MTAITDQIVGCYKPLITGDGWLHPISRWRRSPLFIASEHTIHSGDGSIVLAKILANQWRGSQQATIIRKLANNISDPHVISLTALAANGLFLDDFSPSVLAQTSAAEPIAILGHREDLRVLPLVTIDEDDARDFDDAIWAEPDRDHHANPGGWHLLVAISDVAWYVRPGSALDQAACARGNSVYFPDIVIPMLPERLSNDLCSLLPGVDRPCLAVHIWVGQDGHIIKHRFVRGLMRSAARLTYSQIQAAYNGSVDKITGPLLQSVVVPLYKAWQVLHRRRIARGTLELTIQEYKVFVDTNGCAVEVKLRSRLDSHQLVEEFMIAANTSAAEQISASGEQTCLYRVHARPSSKSAQYLRVFLSKIGLNLPSWHKLTVADFNYMLHRVTDVTYAPLVHDAVLRSQSKAEYSPINVGHFGLGLHRYTHFTSPVRRYADILTHRSLITELALGEGGMIPSTSREELTALATYISLVERLSASAERDAITRYTSMLLASQVGKIFLARIHDTSSAGLHINLPGTGAEGIIPVKELRKKRPISCKDTIHHMTNSYHLADIVMVTLRSVDLLTNNLTFSLV